VKKIRDREIYKIYFYISLSNKLILCLVLYQHDQVSLWQTITTRYNWEFFEPQPVLAKHEYYLDPLILG